MKITRAVTADALDPFSREIGVVECAAGARVRDLLPDGWSLADGQSLVFLNTTRCDDWDREVYEGEIVHFFGGVADPVTIALIAIAVVSAVVSMSLIPDIPSTNPAENPDGGSAYGYYGFQNSFRAEGDPVPVAYGKMRVAPPVINQVIAANSVSQQLSLATREDLYCLLAVSEGPIQGIGIYEGVVENQADQDALVANPLAAKSGSGLQINGIAGTNFIGFINWRTGTLNQEPFVGSAGYVNYTDTAAIYSLGLTPLLGQLGDIGDTAHPAGSYAAGHASLLSNADATQFAEQDLLGQVVDRALVQVVFERGLYTQDGSGGFTATDKTIRIQYRETDASGTPSGNYVLLPAYTVSSSQTTTQVVDIPVEFVTPATFTPPARAGYFQIDADLDHRAQNDQSAAQQLMQPSNPTQDIQQWTWGAWVSSRDNANQPGANHFLFGVSTPATNNVLIDAGGVVWHAIDPVSLSGSEYGFQITLRRDIANAFGNGSQDMYLCLEMWMPGFTGVIGEWRAAVGTIASWGSNGQANPANFWRHVVIQYNGAVGGSGMGATTVTAIVDGSNIYPMTYERKAVVGGDAVHAIYPYWTTTSAQWVVGALQKNNAGGGYYESQIDMAEMFLYDGILNEGNINLIGNPSLGVGLFGNNSSGIRTLLEGNVNSKILLPMSGSETSGSVYYRNYATNPTGTVAETAGSWVLPGGASAVEIVNGPIWTDVTGTAKKSYWQIEVFVSEQTSNNTQEDSATIETITALSSQPYAYTSTALASVNVEADDQVNNQQPSMTLLVKGRIVNTWDGNTNVSGDPALIPAWSRNPAWIAADMLTSQKYGLGAELTEDSVDWPSFLSWAQFCDEGVPDAFGVVNVFGIKAEGSTVVSTEQLLVLYIGITDTAGGTALPEESLPESWRAKDPTTGDSTSFVSITGLTAGGVSSEWVTSDDHVAGLNTASNQLGVYSIEYVEAAFHGYDVYAEVKLRWNRLDSGNLAVWPAGVASGESFFIDDYESLTTLATTSGYENRCQFDGVFDQKDQGAWDAVLQIFTAGRAMPIKAGRKIFAVVDRPRPIVGVFGQGNIITDSLELTYTGPKQMPNSIEGDILDENSNYERRTVLVDHPSVQDPTLFEAFRKERLDFRGVVRASQAMRDATYRLNRYNLVRRHAKFSVGPDAINLLPGDRVLVSHDVPQYGFSGRLRADEVIVNSYPQGGDPYAAWDLQGGSNSLGNALLRPESGVAGPVSSNYHPSELFALPMTADATEPAYNQAQSGSDSSVSITPSWVGQFVATGSQLYPPNTSAGWLAQITSTAYQCAFSVYVKEPTLGACDVVRLSVYRLVEEDGTVIDTGYVGDFTWGSGAITSTFTSTGITASVTGLGSGWFRIGVVYSNAATGGVSNIGDYLQARAYIGANSGGADDGTFLPVADGGRGTNFLKWADPLDCTKSDWTRYNHGTTSIDIDNVAFAAPFYTATDGEYGQVCRLFKPTAASLNPNLVQTHTLTTGSGVASWSNQTITITGYARVGPSNTAANTGFYVDLRYAATVDANNLLNGDGVRTVFITSAGGAPWSVFSDTKYEASGTVNSVSSSVAVVRQTSSANDANWVQFNLSVAYTPSSGTPTAISVAAFTAGGGGDSEMYVWGLRVHGQSSTNVSLNNYYHRKMLFASAQFEDGVGSVNAFSSGASIKLDRDVTLTAGNTYEVLLRSSFAPDAVQVSDNSEVVLVDAAEVPASGTVTKAANASLQINTPSKFRAHEGDIYSFGKQNATSEDFVISRISLDPATLHRDIEAEEYNVAVYDDTAFGTTGTATISDLPSPEASASASANAGIGAATTSAITGRSHYVKLSDDSESDEGGNFVPRIGIRWKWPLGAPVPKEVRIYIERDVRNSSIRTGATDPPRLAGFAPTSSGYFSYSDPLLQRGVTYRVYVQPVGNRIGTTSIRACMSAAIEVRKVAYAVALAAPAVTTATRGWQQIYYLDRISTSRSVDVVEGRVGGWKLGRPAFVIDPDITNTASDVTLVGQLSTRYTVTEMSVFCRSRSAQGHYGPTTTLIGLEQLDDVLYDNSVEASNDFNSNGTRSSALVIDTNGDLHFDAASSDMEGTYTPTSISLGAKPQRVLVNCVPEAFQMSGRTLAELPYTLGSEKMRRWSFEGAMDDMDAGENCECRVEWRWSSTASPSSKAYRVFRPGEVYARSIDFRVTLIRGFRNQDVRLRRLVVQALLPPNFAPADVDGGTFA